MNRCFSQRQRRILAWVAGGHCRVCGVKLSREFHADHKVAFSKGGATTTQNGQALCPPCNLQKGAQ